MRSWVLLSVTAVSTRSGAMPRRECASSKLLTRNAPPDPIMLPAGNVSISSSLPSESFVSVHPLSDNAPVPVLVISIHSSAEERSEPLHRSSEITTSAAALPNGESARRIMSCTRNRRVRIKGLIIHPSPPFPLPPRILIMNTGFFLAGRLFDGRGGQG